MSESEDTVVLYIELAAKKIAEAEKYIRDCVFSKYQVTKTKTEQGIEFVLSNAKQDGIEEAEQDVHLTLNGSILDIDGPFGTVRLDFRKSLTPGCEIFQKLSIRQFVNAITQYSDDVFTFDSEICRAALYNIFVDRVRQDAENPFSKQQKQVFEELIEATSAASTIKEWRRQLGFIQYEDIIRDSEERDLLYHAGDFYNSKIMILYVATKITLG